MAERKFNIHSETYNDESGVDNTDMYREAYPVPVMFPLGWAREHVILGVEKRKRGVGVNHLNLIQIMGRTAHWWQPFLRQEAMNFSSSIIRRPLTCFEINNVLLTADRVKR